MYAYAYVYTAVNVLAVSREELNVRLRRTSALLARLNAPLWLTASRQQTQQRDDDHGKRPDNGPTDNASGVPVGKHGNDKDGDHGGPVLHLPERTERRRLRRRSIPA